MSRAMKLGILIVHFWSVSPALEIFKASTSPTTPQDYLIQTSCSTLASSPTMICRSCLQRASALSRRALPSTQPIYRSFSATRISRQASVADAPPLDASKPAASDAETAVDAAQTNALSSCPPGTVLNGLNYFKNKQDPVALADNEYPAWLWDCLSVQKNASDEAEAEAGDEFCKTTLSRISYKSKVLLTWFFYLSQIQEATSTSS